jgi:hypothetical protein
MIGHDPLLGTYIAENGSLLFVLSSHDCFLSAFSVNPQPLAGFLPRLFPQPVKSCRKLAFLDGL